jgi:tagaturonate epimerase
MEDALMILGKYSFGIGDRFGHQGKAQLSALMKAKRQGLDVTPVWNKSNREHTIIGTMPADVRKEADDAVAACGWKGPYFVDADHIGLANVDPFVESSDFFTLDVADFIVRGEAVPALGPAGILPAAGNKDKMPSPRAQTAAVDAFVRKHKKYLGSLAIDGIEQTFDVSKEQLRTIGNKFLWAVQQAGKIYRHIAAAKGAGNFITEVSMDETDQPQTPAEMFFILAAIADEGIPAQTIAPKFTGRFNKGVDYVGDVGGFTKEFEQDVAVVAFAVKEFGLPENLKLSVHSGSDKFSIYAPIGATLKKFDVGLHIKTAGTTWLEELIGLAMAGGDGLAIAKEVYAKALPRFDELCAPYATVIDIDPARLPDVHDVEKWDGEHFASTLRHDPSSERYNPDLRQLLHIAYKIAAEMGTRYLDALDKHHDIIAQNVAENIYERHVRRIFMGDLRASG